MDAPIIFCHYSNSDYLPHIFEAVRASNPDKRVILLGDKSNRRIAKAHGIEHVLFSDYEFGGELETFNRVYQLVQGSKRTKASKAHWINFVFKRWFYVYNFLKQNDIDSFWHFDTDTTILSPLSQHETKFESYDCTEQCNGSCLNGFISKRETVGDYLNKINNLFEDTQFLEAQQNEFDTIHHNFAFTEMRAYEEFKKEGINSIRLNTILDGSTFDDCITQCHEMEMESLPTGKKIKKIFMSEDGRCYCYNNTIGAMTAMNTLNLSRMPLELYVIILKHLKTYDPGHKTATDRIRSMETLSETYCRIHPLKSRIERTKRALKDKKEQKKSASA
ncbi:MAG TPA: hypothetical protein DCX14_07910 [Flavobacteriales bacterium]|nr:hypothetical protein [Flavobacteriales bacterium]